MCLQNLCIDFIIKNFERYFSNFSNSEDPVLKRGFDFLQRRFSYKIASSLYKKNNLKPEYIDFVVNRHLKTLEFDWLRGCSWDKIAAKLEEVGPVLENVCIVGDYGKPLEAVMCHFSNLRVMTYHTYCTDGILENLAKFCLNVQEIDIRNSSKVTNEGIKRLCTIDGESTSLKLRKICLNNCFRISCDGIAYLIKHMPTLEIIDYEDIPNVLYSMHAKDLLHIDQMEPYNLQKLCFSSNDSDSSDLLKICSCLCPNVKHLMFKFNKQEDLKFPTGFGKLERLHLMNVSYGLKVEINDPLKLIGKKLQYLVLHNVSVSLSDLVKSCPSLQYLSLGYVHFITDSVSSIKFSRLKECVFQGLTVQSAEASIILRSSPNLEDVSFDECFLISYEMHTSILQCCKNIPIKKINFTYSMFELGLIRDILIGCHSLKSIYLGHSIRSRIKLKLKKIARSLRNKPKLYFDSDDDDEFDDDDYSDLDAEFHDYLDYHEEINDDYWNFEAELDRYLDYGAEMDDNLDHNDDESEDDDEDESGNDDDELDGDYLYFEDEFCDDNLDDDDDHMDGDDYHMDGDDELDNHLNVDDDELDNHLDDDDELDNHLDDDDELDNHLDDDELYDHFDDNELDDM